MLAVVLYQEVQQVMILHQRVAADLAGRILQCVRVYFLQAVYPGKQCIPGRQLFAALRLRCSGWNIKVGNRCCVTCIILYDFLQPVTLDEGAVPQVPARRAEVR